MSQDTDKEVKDLRTFASGIMDQKFMSNLSSAPPNAGGGRRIESSFSASPGKAVFAKPEVSRRTPPSATSEASPSLGYLQATASPQAYHDIPDPSPTLGEDEVMIYVTAGHIDNRLPDNYQSHFVLDAGDWLYAEATLTVTAGQYACSALELVKYSSSQAAFVQTGDDFTLARVPIARNTAGTLIELNRSNRIIVTTGGVQSFSASTLTQRMQVVLILA